MAGRENEIGISEVVLFRFYKVPKALLCEHSNVNFLPGSESINTGGLLELLLAVYFIASPGVSVNYLELLMWKLEVLASKRAIPRLNIGRLMLKIIIPMKKLHNDTSLF